MTANSVAENGSLEALAAQVVDEFLARQRRGGKPDPEEYAARHPEASAVLREVLAALGVVGLSSAAGLASGYTDEGAVAGTLGDFRILREVGRGGMGVVYEAEQLSLGRRVALKVLPFAAALDARHLQRFKNEAQAAACLHLPHVVPVHGVGVERGVHYYAMQFIEGQTLAAVIQDLRRSADPPLSGGEAIAVPSSDRRALETATPAALATEKSIRSGAYCRGVAQLGVQAAEALACAHEQGIVHRDIKPANLLLDGHGQLWVTDFGLAQFQRDTRLTMTGDVVGTLRYMSPEQALGHREQVDHRTDIYALGATLYELLTLRPVFAGDDRQELLRRIEREEPTPPRRWNAAVPADLETIVLKALRKEASERYAVAQELADDLRLNTEGDKSCCLLEPGIPQAPPFIVVWADDDPWHRVQSGAMPSRETWSAPLASRDALFLQAEDWAVLDLGQRVLGAMLML